MAVNDLRLLVESCGIDLVGCRDKALLLIGFFTGMRRSEIVALDVEDVSVEEDQGLRLLIRRSKTDSIGMGREVGVPVGRHAATCPVLALRAWLHASGISKGPLFRPLTRWGTVRDKRLSPYAVSVLIKKRTAALGLDPDLYAGHSLRSGMITAAARAGVAEHVIARTTNHKSIATLRGYIQSANVLKEHPAHALDL
jgi:integrase